MRPTVSTLPEDPYPTRGAHEKIRPRRDPVVYGGGAGTGPRSLTPDQVASFEKDGFVVIPDAFSSREVRAMRAEFERLARDDSLRGREEFIMEPDSDALRTLFNPHQFSDLFDRASRDRRFLDPVTQLLGDRVYILHGRINVKPALSGKAFPWHSDFETWHAEDGLPRMRVLSGWVMLTDNTPFNGPLFVVRGSHRTFISCHGRTPKNNHLRSLRKQEYGVPSSGALRHLNTTDKLAAALGKAGTLVFHDGNLLHASPDNIAPEPRTNMFFVYNAVSNKPAPAPFAAPNFRPGMLSSPDHTPIEPVDDAFA